MTCEEYNDIVIDEVALALPSALRSEAWSYIDRRARGPMEEAVWQLLRDSGVERWWSRVEPWSAGEYPVSWSEEQILYTRPASYHGWQRCCHVRFEEGVPRDSIIVNCMFDPRPRYAVLFGECARERLIWYVLCIHRP